MLDSPLGWKHFKNYLKKNKLSKCLASQHIADYCMYVRTEEKTSPASLLASA